MIGVAPSAVLDDIARHLRRAAGGARSNWDVNAANEDSLCGVVLRDLRTFRTRRIVVDGQHWEWQVRARKFGSGGKGSEERQSGADGIVEIEVRHPDGRVEFKGLIIQAKKQWTGTDSRLAGQVRDMERIRPGISAVLDIAPDRYTVVDGQTVLRSEGNRRAIDNELVAPLGVYLADRFLPCAAGLRGVHYDAARKLLYLPFRSGSPDAFRLAISNRLRIEINQVT